MLPAIDTVVTPPRPRPRTLPATVAATVLLLFTAAFSAPTAMRTTASVALGLLAPLVQGRALVTRADIESCLTGAGVPIDVKGSADWTRDSAPFNLRVPYTPVAISVPTTVDHISKSVLCGKQLGVKVSAKSGGHSYASLGFGGEDGHLVVQLDRMYNVSLAEGNIAVVQPGTRLGHLATELYSKYGRAIAHGTCPGYVSPV